MAFCGSAQKYVANLSCEYPLLKLSLGLCRMSDLLKKSISNKGLIIKTDNTINSFLCQ